MTATSSTTRHVRRERIASTATNRRHLATRKPASCGKKGSATIAPARCATWRSKSPVRQRRASGRTNRAAVVSHIACSSTRHRNHRPPQAIRPQRAAWCPRWRRPRLLPVELRPLRPEQRPTWCTRLPRRSSWTTTMLPYCPASSKEVKRGNRRAERSFFFFVRNGWSGSPFSLPVEGGDSLTPRRLDPVMFSSLFWNRFDLLVQPLPTFLEAPARKRKTVS